MGIYLNPTNRMFQKALDRRFYIDKSPLLAFMNERLGTDEAFVCVSRPRRFGKSVDADMLVAYWTRGADSRAQFEGLSVADDPSFERNLNAHDVIKLDISRIVGLADGAGDIPATIARELIPELRGAWPEAIADEVSSLSKALALAEAAKGSGFVFVIDEWDCVFREAAKDTSAQRSYLDFLRDLLKGASYADACWMTGILPIKKYGVHSALNIFTEYSMVDTDELATLTGFNSGDVRELCHRFGKDFDEVSRWYDGYLLGPERVHVFNPRSVAGAMASLSCRSFWTSTETYEALRVYIDMDFDGMQEELVAMLDGQKIACNINLFENDMTTIKSKDDVYALLVHLGYLGYDQVERAVFIPNEEIRREFANAIQAGARPKLAALIADSRELLERTAALDCDYVANAIRRAHDSAAGPMHYNDEQALRAAVKLAYISSIDDYLLVDELPGGRGYADTSSSPNLAVRANRW